MTSYPRRCGTVPRYDGGQGHVGKKRCARTGGDRVYPGANRARCCARDARARAVADRAFARLAALAGPRIRYFTRAYGLADVAEDAAQVCAIALHRAAEAL